MKLFQQMLVAGASLSMLAPVASQASDVVNIEEMICTIFITYAIAVSKVTLL